MRAICVRPFIRAGAMALLLVSLVATAQAQEATVTSTISCIYQAGCVSQDHNADGRTGAADLVAAIRYIALPPLAVAVEINPDPVRPGETMRVALTVSNRGVGPMTGVTVDVPFPSGVNSLAESLISASCPSTTCDLGETIHFDVGNLDPGSGVVYTLPFVVTASDANGTAIQVQANAAAGTISATTTASAVVESGRVLDLAVDASDDPVEPDALLTYTATFGNRSIGLSMGAALELPVPAGTTFVSATDGGTLDGGTVSWDLGTLSPGDGGVRRLVVRVDPLAVQGNLLRAQATISDSNASPNSSVATATARVQSGLPIALALEVNPDPVRPGETLDVGLTATDREPTDVFTTMVVMRQPDDLDYFSTSLISGTCPSTTCDRRENAVYDLGTLTAGRGSTVTYPPIVSAGTVAGTVITFEALASEQGGHLLRARRSVLVQQSPSLDLALDASADPVDPGGELTYTLTFGNRGAGLASGTLLQMPVPAGAVFASASGGGTLDNGVVFWDLGALRPGEGGVRTLVVQVDPQTGLGEMIRADAAISDTSSPADRARASTVTRVEDASALTLSMEINPDPVRPNQTLNVELTSSNRGLVDLTTAAVIMRQPDDLDYFGEGIISGTCPSTTCDRRENAVYDLGTLKAGRGSTVTYPPIVSAGTSAGTVITFEAFGDEQGGRLVRARRSVVVQPSPALSLALDASVDPAAPGTELTYTLTFGNRSAALAPSAVLDLPLPAGTTFVSASDGGALGEGQVSWSLGDLRPGEGGVRRLVVQVAQDLTEGEVLPANAAVTDSNTPADRARASAVTRVEDASALTLSMEINPDPVRPGQTLNVELTPSNRGLVDLTTAAVIMRQPDDLNYFSTSIISGTCPSTTCDRRENAVYDLGTLKAGRGSTVTYPPIVSAGTSAGTVITFEAFGDEQGGRLVRARRSVVVQPSPALSLALDASVDPAPPGTELTYTLTFGNRSAALAPSALLDLPLPAGTTFVSASDGGTLGEGQVSWSLGDLRPGEGGVRRLAVQVAQDLTEGEVLHANAAVSDSNTPADRARASSVTRVESGSPTTLSMEINPDPVEPGQTLDIGITATNRSVVDVFATSITMRQPDDLDYFGVGIISGTCPSTTCDRRENAVYDLGTLKAGRGSTVTYPPIVSAGTSAGTVITFEAFGDEQTGHLMRARRSVLVQQSAALTLALDASADPVEAGAMLTYTLTYGNRGAAQAPATLLQVPVPVGTVFMSATDGGSLNADGAVSWSLGALAPGAGGAVQMTVQVDALAIQGDVIPAEAAISDTNTPADRARASTVTRVESGNPLGVALQIEPYPTLAGQTLNLTLSATNNGLVDLFQAEMVMRVPDNLSYVSVSTIDGTCPSTTCDRREFVTFDLATLASGQTALRTYPPPVLNGTPSGTLIPFEVFASDGSGLQARLRLTERVTSGP